MGMGGSEVTEKKVAIMVVGVGERTVYVIREGKLLSVSEDESVPVDEEGESSLSVSVIVPVGRAWPDSVGAAVIVDVSVSLSESDSEGDSSESESEVGSPLLAEAVMVAVLATGSGRPLMGLNERTVTAVEVSFDCCGRATESVDRRRVVVSVKVVEGRIAAWECGM